MKKICFSIIIIFLVLHIFSITYAGFADFDDKTAEEQAHIQMKQQEEELKESIGKSSNNYLLELSVRNYTLTPSFDKQIVDYEIASNVTEDYIEIIAASEDDEATINNNGKVMLQSGENTINVEVTAPNGMVRTYHIKVNKKIEEKSANLKQLKLVAIDNNNSRREIDISPTFTESVFKYTCKIYNNEDKISIDTIASSDEVEVKIEGNENLKPGNNEVIITLTSKDNSSANVVYKIDVIKPEDQINKENQEDKKENISNYGMLIVIGALIIVFLIILIKVKLKRAG